MTYGKKGGQWLGAIALVAGALTASGCSAASPAEDTTAVVSQTVEAASDSSDAVEVSSLMRGLNALHADAVEGFHCDSSPDITYVTVCGKSLPATVHLDWTGCAAPARPEGGKHGGGAPGGGSGNNPPPPQDGAGGHGGPGGGGGAPEGGKVCGGPNFGPSTGTVDITYTYSSEGDCANDVTQNQSVSFQISRTADDGSVSKEEGTTSSVATLVASGPPQQKQTQADVTRTHTDASGAVVSSVHLTGSMSTAFSSDTPPIRTVNGTYTEVLLDGSQGTVTLADIVRAPRNVCHWPTSGTLTRASSDGTTHTLVFGPDCGTATLDGTAVQLPNPGGPDQGRR
ncbi:MAG: hypothetical protein ACJ8AT_01665 [Hyalangium sp.]|uniref:hypothetical protein n=1 Tax=Hyalangium sp. TaxID=2028555 RepID=UPI003899D9AF